MKDSNVLRMTCGSEDDGKRQIRVSMSSVQHASRSGWEETGGRDHGVMEEEGELRLLWNRQRSRLRGLPRRESRSPQCASAAPPASIQVLRKTKEQLQRGAFPHGSLPRLPGIIWWEKEFPENQTKEDHS